MKKDLIIIGAGNVGAFMAYNLDQFQGSYNLLGFVDDDPAKANKIIAGHKVLGNVSYIENLPKGTAVAVGVASPKARKAIVAQIEQYPIVFPSFVSKTAWLSNNVNVGFGSIIYPGTCINYESTLGNFVIVNMNCAIGHNATIANFCTLAPGVKFGGFTTLEECVEVGIGAATIQGVHLGRNSTIGGQTMVLANVQSNALVVGNPGRVIKVEK